MISINFTFTDQGRFWRTHGLDVQYYDRDGEQACRELIVQGMKKYRTCEKIMKAIGHTQVEIVCNKGVGNWYDNESNTVFFDRTSTSLPHLVSGGHDYTIPALVCLYHELGHAKQYYEKKIWYNSAITVRDSMGVPYQIEYDNLHQHEDPLLREMGIPIRKRYEFFVDEVKAQNMVLRGGTTQ